MRIKTWLAMAAMMVPALAQPAFDRCSVSKDLRLVNGRIHTLDARNSIVSEVVIQDGHFTKVGDAGDARLDACTRTIDLAGRTVVPGLIDNHNHIVLLGMRPGHDIRIETAASIADVQAMLREKSRTVPRGEFITTMGDWNSKQFAEKRAPTMAELDAALPDHPYLMNGSGTIVNTRAKKYFEDKGVTVTAEGTIVGPGFLQALNILRKEQTFADMKRGTLEAMAYMNSFGLTTSVDMGAFTIPGTPNMQDAQQADNVESLNPWTMYDAMLAVHREGTMNHRVRIFFLTQDTRADVPILRERLNNAFMDFGDGMLKASGIGEFGAAWTFRGQETPANYETALKLVAEKGWAFQQHTLSLREDQFTAATFEKVNAVTPIRDLRWSIAHVPQIDKPTLEKLKSMGAGVAVHGWLYLGGAPGRGGPPYRTIVDSGVHVGAGSDAAAVSVFNPWLEIYYMVTGKNSAGEIINDGQQLTRMEALRLYTAENGWFTHEEATLGTIELGKLGDVAVLSADYFDPARVNDEGIKQLRSVLTVVDGKVVHDQLR
ncbi:MAG: amidohydrolase family protein [Acidobacteriota bacterium]